MWVCVSVCADFNGVGSVSRDDLEVYLQSIFTVLMAVEGPSDVSPATLAAFTTRQCMQEIGVSPQSRITVQQFINWYAPVTHDSDEDEEEDEEEVEEQQAPSQPGLARTYSGTASLFVFVVC